MKSLKKRIKVRKVTYMQNRYFRRGAVTAGATEGVLHEQVKRSKRYAIFGGSPQKSAEHYLGNRSSLIKLLYG